MQFHIKCSTFLRLASICEFFDADVDAELRTLLHTVRLEIHDGKMLAIACNQKVAAIELVGNAPIGQNGVAHVVLHPELLKQCEIEALQDGWLIINSIPEIATAFAQTSSGWSMTANACHWFNETPLNNWREWPPTGQEKPVITSGIMQWNLYHIEGLLKSSPTGTVIFPEHIDAMKPIVLRDRFDQNWVGLFVPKPSHDMVTKPAELPEWW